MSDTWPIGQRTTLCGGTIIEVADELEEGSCKGCFFDNNPSVCNAPAFLGKCLPAFRDDHIGIIFKEIGHIGG